MHFTKFTKFLNCFKSEHNNIKRYKTTLKEVHDILMNEFDITETYSIKLAKKNNLFDKPNILKEKISSLESLGYDKTDILKHNSILKKKSRQVRGQYFALEEVGFSNLNLPVLENFRNLFNSKISQLKELYLIPQHLNVVQRLISYLQPQPTKFQVDKFSNDSILGQVHGNIIKHYLQWRLDATADEIETFFRIYSKFLKYKSFEWICENIQIAIDLGFTPRKLLGFGYLLANDPSYPKAVLEKMPNFAGADMRVMMRRFPKLITVPPLHYMEIYKILQDEDIPDSTIQKQMNIFTLTSSTVKTRFDEIRNIPEMNVLRQSPRILRLIIHHNRAKSRLSFMHQLQLKCASMCLLEHDNKHYFEQHVRNTKDTNVLGDIVTLLRHLLKSTSTEIEFNLRKHPYYLQVPLVNIEKTCKHMQQSFSNSALIKVAPILLYPSEKIEEAFNQISTMSDLPVKHLTETKKLNLALYLIEKNYHFTGDGVWENQPDIPS